MRWWSGYPLTAGYSNSLFLCKMSVCCCLSLCKATAVWCHTCCLISTQQHLFAGDETPGLPRRGCWVCVVRERLVLMTGNKNTSKTSTKNQAINKHLSAEEEKVFRHQLSGEWEESRAAAGDVSSHCYLKALCPSVRNFSNLPGWNFSHQGLFSGALMCFHGWKKRMYLLPNLLLFSGRAQLGLVAWKHAELIRAEQI